jgi:hypothetical protein
MAFPQTSVTDIVATTLQGYSGELADNVLNHNALLYKLDQKGNKVPATGRTIVQELEYQSNATVQWYSGSEPLDTSPTDTFTYAEYAYKQLAGNVVINGLEQIQNSGKEAVHNLLKSRIKNLEKSLKNTLSTSLYSTGTTAKEIGGLRLLVSDDYLFYLESLTANQRFVDEKMAAAGWMNVMFMGSPVFFDDQAPSAKMYALNTDYLYLRPAKGREFVPLGEKSSVNQDAIVMPVVWAGNLTCSNRSLQGVICA